MANDSDAEFEQLLARRRAENAREVRRRWLMVAAVATVPLLLGAVAGVRSLSKDTKEWTHEEMANYLGQRGVQVAVRPSYGRNAYYCEPGTLWDIDSVHVVEVWLENDAQQAKEIASTSPNRFNYGRFVFIGSGQFYNRIKSKLQ